LQPLLSRLSSARLNGRGASANGTAGVRDIQTLTTAERVDLGRAARRAVPRASHATFEPPPERPDPVEMLEYQARTRVPELLPIRYGRMLSSPFAFFRGGALIMACDLAPTPRSGLTVQCCGDAHISNFGVFASPERRLVFDVNDFDETLPGPWEWDIKRLAVSVMIAARENGFSARRRERAVLDTVGSYRSAMRSFAAMRNLDVWYANADAEEPLAHLRSQVGTKMAKRTEQVLARAHTRDSTQALSKLTHMVAGQPRIVAEPPLIVPIDELAEGGERPEMLDALHEQLRTYRATLEFDRRVLLDQFRVADFARKVVGVGSVGTQAWIALMLGLDGQDPLFLQIKQAEASVLEAFLGASEFDSHGERVVAGQRLMQASSDILLGWLALEPGPRERPTDYYVRQLRDWKSSPEIAHMTPKGMAQYGRLCGWTLARAHARSGDRIAIAAYLGAGAGFDRALLEFSEAYAEQNGRDHAALAAAVDSGRITAEKGV
jgi:uncharacterized protein (DUF2252 family)